MHLLALAAIVAALVALVLFRRPAEHDVTGDPALRLRPAAMALLPPGLYLLFDALVLRLGEAYALHHGRFVLLVAVGLLLLASAGLLFAFRITLEPKRILLRVPLLWQRTLPLSQLVEIQDDALIPILVFTRHRHITVLPLYSGAESFLRHLREACAEREAARVAAGG